MVHKHGIYGSALAAAVTRGRVHAAKVLILHGADVNLAFYQGKYGCVLEAALKCGQSWCAKML